MTNEEFERHKEFTLQQQARIETDLGKQRQRSTEDWARQIERNAEVDRRIEQLVTSLSLMREAVVGLTHYVERHDNHLIAIERAMLELADQSKFLMAVVERHISGHQ